MTNQAAKSRGPAQKFLQVFPILAVLFCMLFLLRNPTLAKEAVWDGLRRATTGVLPSVFPFLILSDLLISIGGLPFWISRWLCRLLNLSPAACSVVLLGWICGFPIGACCAVREIQNRRIPRAEAERAVATASIPSPAFLVGAVGAGILQNATDGWLLWLFCIASAFGVCFVWGRIKPLKSQPRLPQGQPEPTVPPAAALVASVGKSALTALRLCAFVTFFSVLSAALQSVFERFSAPALCGVLGAAFLELSGGVFSAATLSELAKIFPLCAFACGWAGLSIHFQIFSVCEPLNFKAKPYLFAKGIQALLCTGFALLLVALRQ